MSINDYIGKFIQKENLLASNVNILLAVSGGLDSMVLLTLLHSSKVKIGVAHINYKLRPQSDEEQALVKQFCEEHNLPFHSYTASKKEQANLQKGNLQSKARNIRYNFFKKLMKEMDYTHLATAHHQGDQVEGFFLNALRGSGVDGLSSLSEIKGNLLRPLLQFDKASIQEYADKNNILYLHDHTNFESHYDRNFIRNEVLPILENRFPNYANSISKTIQNLADSNDLLHYLIAKEVRDSISYNEGQCIINNFTALKNIPGSKTLLYYLLNEYGYNSSQVFDILNATKVGALFYSDTHETVLDRDRLIVRDRNNVDDKSLIIDGQGSYRIGKKSILVIQDVTEKEELASKNIAFLDSSKIDFPFEIRKWKAGDRFCPLGMKGRSKKVKDFLTNLKLSRFDKADVKVIVNVSNGNIIWVMGYRIDERYMLTPHSTKIIRLEIKNII